MSKVIFNQKGGVGKSSISCNLAAISADQGKRTLVVDLDPQCNTTHYLLGFQTEPFGPTLADFFDQTLNFRFDSRPVEAFIHATPFDNLFIMPAHPALEELQSKLESRYKIYKLREALQTLSESFEHIYIDTPPLLNFYTRSALIAADTCLIPFDCDAFSRQALYALLNHIEEIRLDHHPELRVEGIIINQYQARASLPQQVAQELIAEGLPVMEPFLSSSVKMKESHQHCRPLIFLDRQHKLTQEYVALHHALIHDKD